MPEGHWRRNLWQIKARNMMLKSTFSSCCLQNLRNPAKFSENSNFPSSMSSEVIDLGANRKLICNFLLVITSNYGRIYYRFRDIDAFSSKLAWFSPPNPCLTPPSCGTPCTINVIYTPLESRFKGLQIRQYGSIFIRLAVVASQNR